MIWWRPQATLIIRRGGRRKYRWLAVDGGGEIIAMSAVHQGEATPGDAILRGRAAMRGWRLTVEVEEEQ